MATSVSQHEQAPSPAGGHGAAKDDCKIHKLLQVVGVSVALAAYSSWVVSTHERSARSQASGRSIPATDIPLIRLDEAKALWSAPSTVFVDVRPAFDYELGHIAGAVNLPGEEWDQRFAALKPRLAAARAVIVYCGSANCGKSYWSGLRLRQEGLPQVMIYPEGRLEWENHGLPITATAK